MSGLEMKYFVLKPRSKNSKDQYAHASRMAMITYAQHINDINPQLADDLVCWADRENDMTSKMIDEDENET